MNDPAFAPRYAGDGTWLPPETSEDVYVPPGGSEIELKIGDKELRFSVVKADLDDRGMRVHIETPAAPPTPAGLKPSKLHPQAALPKRKWDLRKIPKDVAVFWGKAVYRIRGATRGTLRLQYAAHLDDLAETTEPTT